MLALPMLDRDGVAAPLRRLRPEDEKNRQGTAHLPRLLDPRSQGLPAPLCLPNDAHLGKPRPPPVVSLCLWTDRCRRVLLHSGQYLLEQGQGYRVRKQYEVIGIRAGYSNTWIGLVTTDDQGESIHLGLHCALPRLLALPVRTADAKARRIEP